MYLLDLSMFTSIKSTHEPLGKKNLWAFPVYCQNCGIRLLGPAKKICRYCILSELPRIYPEPKKGMYPEGIEWQVACWKYDEAHLIQRLIHQLKHKAAYDIGVDLGRAPADLFRQAHPYKYEELISERPLVVPVPLSEKRRNSRGYNQSYSIAEGWAIVASLPILREGVIARRASKINQVQISKSERRMNMEGVYRLACPSVYDWVTRPVLIMDDVYTTGATCFALWRFLKSIGFKKSYLITLAMA